MNKYAPALFAIWLFFFVNHACGQWIQTSLSGKSVFALAVSGGKVFAGTNGGVFLSTDNGSSWTAVNAGLSNPNVSCLAVSGGKILAGTNGGVFLSTNNGTSWTAITSGLPSNTSVRSLAVSGNIIFAGTDDGVYLSANSGTSWTVINGPTITVYSFAVSGSNVFAGTKETGIYLCTNNGTSWTAVDSGLTNCPVFSLAVSGSNIFAGTYSGGISLSTNNGSSWTAVNSGLPKGDEIPIVLSLAVSGSNIFAGTGINSLGFGGDVFLSTNNGASWNAVNSLPFKSDTVYALAVSGSNIFAGTGGGLFFGDSGRGVWRRPLSETVSVVPQNHQTSPLQTRLRIAASGSVHSGVMLNYSLQSRCNVHLGIYAVSGKQVALIDQGERSPGEYSVRFDNGAIPSGLYACRFQAGNYQQSSRLMIVK